MDVQIFVQNLKRILDDRGISYSKAGKESGAGAEFIRNMERQNSAPSIIRVQQMADYLGITVGELLGEKKESTVTDGDELSKGEQVLIDQFRKLTPEQQDLVIGMVRNAADKM